VLNKDIHDPNALIRALIEMNAKHLNVCFSECLRANLSRMASVRRSDSISEIDAVDKVAAYGSLGLTNH